MKRHIRPTNVFLNGQQEFRAHFREENHGVAIRPFEGRDFSSLTALFPGQGVVFEGQFGEWLNGKSRVRDFFQQADAYVQVWSLPKVSLYLTAPQRLNPSVRVKLKNLALFALEVGLYEELTRLGLSFRRLSGYSFGEYAAWTAAGVLSFSQMLEVIYWREELAPAAHSVGAMILVGASDERIKASLAGREYYISNRLQAEQVIIACPSATADGIVKDLLKLRIPCKKLKDLAQPYHSPLMQETASHLAEKISELKLEIAEPRLPIYSSVLHRWVDSSTFNSKVFTDVLSRQLTEPVDLVEIGRALETEGTQSLIELGPDSVADILLQQNSKAFVRLPLSDYVRGQVSEEKKYDEKIQKSKFVSVVSKVVAKLTGYEIEDITIEDRFQEDLGIDSLKKAEVMFEVLNAANVDVESDMNTSRFKSLGDLVEYLEHGPQEGESRLKAEKIELPFARHFGSWVPQTRDLHLPVHTAFRELRIEVAELIAASAVQRSRILEALHADDSRNFLLRLECPVHDEGFAIDDWETLVRFWRDLTMELPDGVLNVALVGEANGSSFAGLRAFLKSASRERADFVFLPVGCRGERPESSWLWAQLQRPRLAERRLTSEVCEERVWRKEGSRTASQENAPAFVPKKIVCLGGAGGIAYELLSKFPQRGSCDVHLIGRRPATDISVQDRISMLELEFASVTYHQADASSRENLHAVLDRIENHGGGIDFLINATGVDRSSPVKTKSNEEISDEIRQKLLPALNLEEWCMKGERSKIYRSHFSSIVGLFGNSSQSVYALGNAALSAQVLKSGGKNVFVVHWPAWQNVGMTARSAVRLTLMESGVSLLKPEDGARFFWEDIASSRSGEVTYVTEAYLLAEAGRNARFDLINGFMGNITNYGRRAIEKNFRLSDDTYLLDHCIQGKCCVPAAAVLVSYLELVHLIEGEFKPIRAFEMLNMLIVDREGIRVNVGMRPINGEMRLYHSSIMSHAQAMMGSGEEPAIAPKAPCEASPSREAFPIKHFYATGKLFHGPRLKVIHDAWKIDTQTTRGRIERSKLTEIYGCDFFDVLMPVIDGAFQLLVISSYLKKRMMALPVGVKFLRLNADVEWTDHFWVQVEDRGVSDGLGRGNAFIYNDKGEIIVEMADIAIREGAGAAAVEPAVAPAQGVQ